MIFRSLSIYDFARQKFFGFGPKGISQVFGFFMNKLVFKLGYHRVGTMIYKILQLQTDTLCPSFLTRY